MNSGSWRLLQSPSLQCCPKRPLFPDLSPRRYLANRSANTPIPIDPKIDRITVMLLMVEPFR